MPTATRATSMLLAASPYLCDPSTGLYHDRRGATTACRVDDVTRSGRHVVAESSWDAQAQGYAPHACVVA